MAKASRTGTEARRVRHDTRRRVLHEAGYKCANPCCRHPLTLDVHHLLYVSEGGADGPENLLPLCPNCHTLHHHRHIATESLRAWKMLLVSLNEGFDRRSIDILLVLAQIGFIGRVSGDGLPAYTSLAASGLVSINEFPYQVDRFTYGQDWYRIHLTDKGKMFVDAWRSGDQATAVALAPDGSEVQP